MEKVLFIAQITVSAALVVAILMQNRGSGVSAIFGGGSGSYRTKRGLEKGLHTLTIILVIVFVAIGVVNLVITS